MDKTLKKLNWDTICVKENMDIISGESHILPLHSTSAFSYKSIEESIEVFEGRKKGFVYGRYGNPTVESVQNKLALLESRDILDDAFCIMTASGLAALSTLCFSLLQPGDSLLTQNALYGGSTEFLHKLMNKFGVNIIIADLQNENEIRKNLEENETIRLIYFETPTNPTLSCVDISLMAKLAKEYGKLSVIDNTFCTSYLQQPMAQGVDYVIHSTTKFINGHGNSIAGAIIGRDKETKDKIWESMKLLGTNTNAWDAWLTHTGLKTLAIRMDRACGNALTIAKYLETHDKVKKVNYPGLESNPYHTLAKKQMKQFGAMLSFEIDGGFQDGVTFMNQTKICTIAATLGNVDTLLLHPASSSHLSIDPEVRKQNGITDGLIRVSVGIENIEDLLEDISYALELI